MPMPVSKDSVYVSESNIKLDDLKTVSSGVIVFGGKISDKLKYYLTHNGIKWVDYAEIETLAVKNAVATAEGAISILLSQSEKTLFGSNCLVVGYGRIGKVLSALLKAFGANVSASSRSESERWWCKINGLNTVSTYDIANIVNKMDIIINTAPFLIFTPAILDSVKKDTIILDLASKPGGVDFEYAKSKNINVTHALSLPGKCAPLSAAQIVAETILEEIRKGV